MLDTITRYGITRPINAESKPVGSFNPPYPYSKKRPDWSAFLFWRLFVADRIALLFMTIPHLINSSYKDDTPTSLMWSSVDLHPTIVRLRYLPASCCPVKAFLTWLLQALHARSLFTPATRLGFVSALPLSYKVVSLWRDSNSQSLTCAA